MVTEKQRKAREKFVRKYAGKKGKKKKGTTKGEVRKTARRAFEPKITAIYSRSGKPLKQWLKDTIKTREANPQHYSSDYSRGELRGYKEALKEIEKK
jgi:hypothetical protein